MVKDFLIDHFEKNKLYNAYLISTNSIKNVLSEIEVFLQKKIFKSKIEDGISDLLYITNRDQDSKITIDQIRNINAFVSKKSLLSGYRFVVIYPFDALNVNASNACLKLLEDKREDAYFLLISENINSISDTIKSRTYNVIQNYNNHYLDYKLYHKIFNSNKSKSEALDCYFINKIDEKNIFGEFIKGILVCINIAYKDRILVKQNITDDEQKILDFFNQDSLNLILDKFAKCNIALDDYYMYGTHKLCTYINIINSIY